MLLRAEGEEERGSTGIAPSQRYRLELGLWEVILLHITVLDVSVKKINPLSLYSWGRIRLLSCQLYNYSELEIN